MIELKDAIEISRILAKAPQERLPMILSVFEKAELTIEGLEELDEWRLREAAAIVDYEEFERSVIKKFSKQLDDGKYIIPAADFTEFCKEMKLNPAPTRRWLAKKGILESSVTKDKTNYTIVQCVNGKNTRCVVLNFKN